MYSVPIQIMPTDPQKEGLEGIKFAKFLKRATGSRRMSSALLKTAATAAVIGGTAYYTNKKYHWWDKLKAYTPMKTGVKTGTISTTATTTKALTATGTVAKTAANKGANSWFSGDFLTKLVSAFIPTAQANQQPQAQINSKEVAIIPQQQSLPINPLVLGGFALLGGYLLLKKR